MLRIFHLKRPIFGPGEVRCHESLIRRVCFKTSGQKMDIPVPYPGNLYTHNISHYIHTKLHIHARIKKNIVSINHTNEQRFDVTTSAIVYGILRAKLF